MHAARALRENGDELNTLKLKNWIYFEKCQILLYLAYNFLIPRWTSVFWSFLLTLHYTKSWVDDTIKHFYSAHGSVLGDKKTYTHFLLLKVLKGAGEQGSFKISKFVISERGRELWEKSRVTKVICDNLSRSPYARVARSPQAVYAVYMTA